MGDPETPAPIPRWRRILDAVQGFAIWLGVSVVSLGIWSWLPGRPLARGTFALAIFLMLWVWGFHQRESAWRRNTARLILLVLVVVFCCLQPKGEADWIPGHARAVSIAHADGVVILEGVRDFQWGEAGSLRDLRWVSRRVPLDRLDEVWFWLEPLRPGSPFAHVMLSFSWRDERGQRDYLAVSVEARRELGEDYHPVAGCFRRYELIYVIGTEADVIALRATEAGSDLRLYRGKATPDQVRELFRQVLVGARECATRPAFYHAILENCAGRIAQHVRSLWPGALPGWEWRLIATGGAAEVGLEAGLLEPPWQAGAERVTERIRDLNAPRDRFGDSLRQR